MSIHYMAFDVQSARRIVVNSRPSPRWRQSREPSQSNPHGLPREAGGRQNRLLGAHVGFSNPGLRLQPAPTGGLDGSRRAQGWAHRSRWRTRTVIESRHWKAGGPGLRVLCSSPRTEDESPASMMDGRRTTSLCRQQSMAILPFRNSSEDPATADIAERSAREHSLAGAR